MSASHPNPKARVKEQSLYEAVIDAFLTWIHGSHDEWHRRMATLHEDLEKAHRTSSGRADESQTWRR